LLASEQGRDLFERVTADRVDLHFFVAAEVGDLLLEDLNASVVGIRSLASEHLGADHGSEDAGRHTERSIANVAGLFTEDRPEELLFGRKLGFTLRSHFAHEDITRLHFRADADDTGGIEVLEGLFPY